MKMLYKINTGYGTERYIPIEADELEKAYGLFLMGGRAVFRKGAVDSKVIQDIVPDWHAIMGWSHDWQLGPDDYNELASKGIDRQVRELQNATQEKVQYLIQNGKTELIGKNVDIPELAKLATTPRTEGMKSLKELLPSKI